MLKFTTVICAGILFGLVMTASSMLLSIERDISDTKKVIIASPLHSIRNEIEKMRGVAGSKAFNASVIRLQETAKAASQPAKTNLKTMWPDPRNLSTVKQLECRSLIDAYDQQVEKINNQTAELLIFAKNHVISELNAILGPYVFAWRRVVAFEVEAQKVEASSDTAERKQAKTQAIKDVLRDIRDSIPQYAQPVVNPWNYDRFISFADRRFKEDEEKIKKIGTTMNQNFQKCVTEAAEEAAIPTVNLE